MAGIDFDPVLALSKTVDDFLEAWSKELAEEAKVRDHLQERDYQEQIIERQAERARERDKALEESTAAAEAINASAEIEGLLGLVRSTDSRTITIPSEFRAAANLVVPAAEGLSGQIGAVLREIGEDDPNLPWANGRDSARWAIEHGLLPHPSDLALILAATGIHRAIGERLGEIGDRLDLNQSRVKDHPQLKAQLGGERLDALQEYVQVLGAYSPTNLVLLLSQPQLLAGRPAPDLPVWQSSRMMSPRDYNAMIDRFTKR